MYILDSVNKSHARSNDDQSKDDTYQEQTFDDCVSITTEDFRKLEGLLN